VLHFEQLTAIDEGMKDAVERALGNGKALVRQLVLEPT
jgi:hypothetical protein